MTPPQASSIQPPAPLGSSCGCRLGAYSRASVSYSADAAFRSQPKQLRCWSLPAGHLRVSLGSCFCPCCMGGLTILVGTDGCQIRPLGTLLGSMLQVCHSRSQSGASKWPAPPYLSNYPLRQSKGIDCCKKLVIRNIGPPEHKRDEHHVSRTHTES